MQENELRRSRMKTACSVVCLHIRQRALLDNLDQKSKGGVFPYFWRDILVFFPFQFFLHLVFICYSLSLLDSFPAVFFESRERDAEVEKQENQQILLLQERKKQQHWLIYLQTRVTHCQASLLSLELNCSGRTVSTVIVSRLNHHECLPWLPISLGSQIPGMWTSKSLGRRCPLESDQTSNSSCSPEGRTREGRVLRWVSWKTSGRCREGEKYFQQRSFIFFIINSLQQDFFKPSSQSKSSNLDCQQQPYKLRVFRRLSWICREWKCWWTICHCHQRLILWSHYYFIHFLIICEGEKCKYYWSSQ